MSDQRLRSLATTLLVCFIWSLLLPVAVFADTDESDSTAATAASSAQLRTYTRPRITHPADGAVVSGKVEVRITSNAPKDSNVVLLLDGRLRAISNVPPFVFELDTDKMTEGAHTLQAQVYLANGDRTNSTISTIQVGSPPVFKTTPFPQPAERPIVSKIEVPVSAALPTRSEEPPLTAQADLVRLSQEAVSLLQPTRIARTPGPSTTTA
ncbi:MAG: hypothetical protein GTN69_04485, partial [Armatimonadetes bacterium]|nr:hypothetical protein [Armatimonadota bacterium]NIO75142.1 hypothetical protein [Armatimonadota bacterium]NIO95766.1 hypothetical protein [Armatimonadota bacterium]